MGITITLENWLEPNPSASELPRLVVLSSDEPLFQTQVSDQMRRRLRQSIEYQRHVLEQDRSFDPRQFLGLLSEGSLFGDISLIELRLSQPKLTKDLAEALELASQWANEGRLDHYLLVTAPRLNKTQMNSAGYKALMNAGAVIQCPSLNIDNLPGWLTRTARNKGLQLRPEASQWLAENTEGNLLAAFQCIERLAIDCEGEVSVEQVQQVATDSSRYNVFDLGKAMLAADKPRIARMLSGLHAEGQAPTLVLWSVLEEVRALSAIKEALVRGTSLQDACRNNRVWGDRQKLMPSACRRHSNESLKALLQACYECEKIIKGLRTGSPWPLFEMIGLSIAGEPLPELEH
ncbi:MAG: DNA polymerase III subunit delta [Limnobacter sp.]|nr:DNA polymerase III subunit delta [Limnobacter sp.]